MKQKHIFILIRDLKYETETYLYNLNLFIFHVTVGTNIQ